ncbi:hypothetical protein Mal4_23160 [Maioricimonas rarisocia]|uniref:Uncharacterized protein n=1 Tax=Maioricimonas rarisocia TaxID=2528026 RepID=A0A517Z691_9PLAN|nr:hypothetical protein [Maioricimonas rarisocia]QDU37997.1 hypothetical protein Mal4_23160 [Maioricimonas rarisocia]
MGLAKDVLERQLELADADLKKHSDRLTEAGLDQKAQKKDPTWRSLNATRRQIRTRLQRVAEIRTRDEELAARKASSADEE